VTVFTHKNNSLCVVYCINVLEKILHRFPTIIVDLAEIEYSGDNRTLNILAHKNPRESKVLYIIVKNEDNENISVIHQVLRDTFQKIVHMAPRPQRPKCLVLIFGSNKGSEKSAENILKFAWENKFLDVTMLKIDELGNKKKIVYNPFKDLIDNAYLNDEDCLFPQKLNDMNNYPLKISMYDDPPFSSFYVNKKNEVIADGMFIGYIKTFSEAVNLKISYKFFYPMSASDKTNIYLNFESNDINMIQLPVLAGRHMVKDCGLRNGVPIMKMSKIRFNVDNIAFPFEWGSPYLEKFNIILRKVIESGIPKLWSNIDQNKYSLLSRQKYSTSGNTEDNTIEENYEKLLNDVYEENIQRPYA
ncbi:hypothetical protein TSAR_000669, partial [Trichomalopsis sarcophagae]